jgi:hypothetical protein
MSRYAPGYTGPMTTAGGVPKGPKPAGTVRDSRPIKPVKPGKGTPDKPSPKGKTPLSGMGKMMGMAYGGMTKKGYNKGGMANCGASMKPAQGKGKK